jgi:eukaryotic-like serine/threonine-protein kinase
MRLWDSVTQGKSGRPGPTALAIVIVGMALALPPVAEPIASAYGDFLQGLQAGSAGPDVVIVDTGVLAAEGETGGASHRYPDLLRRLRELNAQLVVESEPRSNDAADPNIAQLAELADAEARNRAAGGASMSARFAAEIAAMRRRADLEQRVAQEVLALRNVVVAVPAIDGSRGLPRGAGCVKQVFSAARPDSTVTARRVRAMGTPGETICRGALTAGHVEFWPDSDGVVRRLNVLIDSGGKLVPAGALRAAMAVTNPTGVTANLSDSGISWGERSIKMDADATVGMRFYSGDAGGFGLPVINAASLLAGDAVEAQRVRGRVVVLGTATARPDTTTYRTPTAADVPAAVMVATGIANLIDKRYVLRPAWLTWAEGMLLLTLGGLLLSWHQRVPPAVGVMTGLSLAVLLLAIEAFMLLDRGLAIRLSNIAIFMLAGWALAQFLREPDRRRRPAVHGEHAPAKSSSDDQRPAPVRQPGLDEEFSRLRHQPPSEELKIRLYEIALEHARLHDLAKAERVLRHLAGIDPEFRNAGEKLRKLTGLRNAPAEPAARKAETPTMTRPADSADMSGQTIGRYRIEQPIGRGAMATVYLGRDPKINRRVAIKTIALAEEFADNDLVNAKTQFLREAESAGRLNHPHIITIYDAGEDGSVAYLAMEYFQGKALSHYAQQGNLLPAKTVLELMARAADALHYAHGQHVVHRDIKPANLMYDRSSDALKITDFGIARLTDTSKTKTGIILGTPSYMSPEQLAGGNVTGQSDLFSLGVTLYQLLTGLAPFRADSIPKLMQKIAHERHESVRLIRDDLPRAVDVLLDQALAKDPADRFPSGRSMATALRACGNSLGTAAAS